MKTKKTLNPLDMCHACKNGIENRNKYGRIDKMNENFVVLNQ